jgi:hypothetical protein
MTSDLSVRAIVRSIMAEVEVVGNRWGVELPISIERRIAVVELGDAWASICRIREPFTPVRSCWKLPAP